MSYSEYPKVMTHPQHKPAIPYVQPRFRPGEEGWGKAVDPGQTGRPEQFPNVSVNNPDQEAAYAAKGYVPYGVGDPEAYRRAKAGIETTAEPSRDYPRMLYKADDNGKVQHHIVKNAEQEDEYAKKGWKRTQALALRASQDGDEDEEMVTDEDPDSDETSNTGKPSNVTKLEGRQGPRLKKKASPAQDPEETKKEARRQRAKARRTKTAQG